MATHIKYTDDINYMEVTKPELKLRNGNEILLHSVTADPKGRVYDNVDLLHEILPAFEENYLHFWDDSLPSPTGDYEAWLAFNIEFINSASPWFFVSTVNGRAEGAIWAYYWDSYGADVFSCLISGFARKGVNPKWTEETIRQLTAKLFAETTVYIVRSEIEAGNRAAQIAMRRAGFTHPEPRRVIRVRNGEEVNGIILSMTRKEFEGQHHE